MCVGIKYLHDGQRACVYFDSPQPDLRILQRDGGIRFLPLGRTPRPATRAMTISAALKRFPEESCARLEDIRAGKWSSYEPRSLRILAITHHPARRHTIAFVRPLKRGEFMPGLLTSIRDHQRGICVVTLAARQNMTSNRKPYADAPEGALQILRDLCVPRPLMRPAAASAPAAGGRCSLRFRPKGSFPST